MIDSIPGSIFEYNWFVPNVVSDSCKILIRSFDLVGLSSSDTSNYFSIVDGIRPEIIILTPIEGYSIPEYEPLTVSWTATDNIAMDSVQIIYLNNPDSTHKIVGKVPADSSQFTFNVPAGITDQAVVYLHGWDISGNDTLVHSPYFSVTDNTPPDSVVIAPIEQCSIGDTKSITWIAGDNSGAFRAHYVFSSNSDEPFTFIDSVDGTVFNFDWEAPNILTDRFRIKITSYDLVGLSSSDTSNYFSIVDGIRPEISIVTPIEGYAIPEYEPLTVSWTATDNIAMDSVQIIYLNNPDSTQKIVGKVPADSSQFTFNVPAGVTDQAIVCLHGWDISGNDTLVHSPYFSVTDNTPPEVALLNQLQGSELPIGRILQINWEATDNAAVAGIDLYYTTDLGNTWKTIFTNGTNDGIYMWEIPDDPSDQCRLKIVARDGVGLSSEALSGDPFSIVIEYPCLISASSIISQRDSIWLHFTQKIDTDRFSGGLNVLSVVSDNPDIQYMFGDNSRSVALFCDNSFTSADTLSIILAADQVTNVFGYGLDGNQNSAFEGAPIDNDTIEVIVRYSADFDNNDQVNWDDLVILSEAWYGRDYRYELGPVSGNPPHFRITPDSLFNIEDAMTFGRMWNWQSGLSKRIITMPRKIIGSDIVTEQIGNTIVIHSLPVAGKRVVVQYNSDLISVTRKENQLLKPSELTFNLYAECPDSERVEFVTFSFDQDIEDEPISFLLNSKERRPVDIKIGFEGINAEGELVQSSLSILRFQPVPDKYELYPNYPNPFNAQTVIEYGIPEKSAVTVEIYDLRGCKVRTLVEDVHGAHYYRRLWDGRDDGGRPVASGLYFLRIVAVGETHTFTKTQKMVMIR